MVTELMMMVEAVHRRLVRSSFSGLSSHVSFLVFYLKLQGLINSIVVAGMIVYGVWDSCVRGNNRRPPHAGNGYGGGWGGDDGNNGKSCFSNKVKCRGLTESRRCTSSSLHTLWQVKLRSQLWHTERTSLETWFLDWHWRRSCCRCRCGIHGWKQSKWIAQQFQ